MERDAELRDIDVIAAGENDAVHTIEHLATKFVLGWKNDGDAARCFHNIEIGAP